MERQEKRLNKTRKRKGGKRKNDGFTSSLPSASTRMDFRPARTRFSRARKPGTPFRFTPDQQPPAPNAVYLIQRFALNRSTYIHQDRNIVSGQRMLHAVLRRQSRIRGPEALRSFRGKICADCRRGGIERSLAGPTQAAIFFWCRDAQCRVLPGPLANRPLQRKGWNSYGSLGEMERLFIFWCFWAGLVDAIDLVNYYYPIHRVRSPASMEKLVNTEYRVVDYGDTGL